MKSFKKLSIFYKEDIENVPGVDITCFGRITRKVIPLIADVFSLLIFSQVRLKFILVSFNEGVEK